MENFKWPFFRKVFLSYTIIAAITLLSIFIPLSLHIRGQDQQILIKERNNKIQSLVQLLDEQFSSMEQISLQLTSTSWVTKISSNSDVLSKQIGYMEQRDICREMKRYHGLIRIARSTALLLPQKELAVDSVSIWGINDFFSSIGIKQMDFWPDFMETISGSPHSLGIYQTPSYPDGFFIFKQLNYTDSPKKQILLFAVDSRQLSCLVSQSSMKTVNAFEIRQNGNTVYSSDIKADEGEFYTVENVSSLYPWSYTFQISVIGSQLNSGNWFLIITVLFSLTVGVLMAFILASTTSRPLYILLKNIGYQPARRVSEFAQIDNAFSQLNGEKDDLEFSSQKYLSVIRQKLLSTLVKGAFELEPFEADLDTFQLPFNNEMWFMILLVGYFDQDNWNEAVLDCVKIKKYLERQRTKSVGLLKESPYSAVIVLADLEDAGQLMEHANQIREFLIGNFPSGIEVYCIPPQKGLLSVSKMYQEAKKCARKERRLQPRSYYSINMEIQLINQLRLGNSQTARAIILKLQEKNELQNLFPEEMHSCIQAVVNTILRVAADIGLDFGEVETEFFQNILTTENADWAWDYLCSLSDVLCQRASTQNHSKDIDMGCQMIAYVQAHYCEASLSQQELADMFNISRSAVSKIFKNAAKVNFIDYIHLLRIQKAKEYFYSGLTNILEVAQKTGYDNEITFKRAFQRFESMTPRKYIDMYC